MIVSAPGGRSYGLFGILSGIESPPPLIAPFAVYGTSVSPIPSPEVSRPT